MRKPIIAGLTAAALMAWYVRPRPAPQSLSLRSLLIVSAVYVLTVFLTSAAAGFLTLRFKALRNGTLQVATTAVWIAPLLLLILYGSLWAVAASVLLAFSVVSAWNAGKPGESRFTLSLCASVFLQLAFVAAIAESPRVAAMTVAIGAGVLIWMRPERWAASVTAPRALPRMALAIVLTAIALSPFLLRVQGDGTDKWLEALLAGQTAGGGTAKERTQADRLAEAMAGGEFSGVIMTPEETRHTMLMPPLPSLRKGLAAGPPSKPLSIPFFGAYWFFRPPFRRPPPNSYKLRGSTTKTVFRSTDNSRLFMEAHQNFGIVMDVSCCQRIDLAVHNADPEPETVWLELLLSNTLLAQPALSLGKATIKADSEQILSFTVPPNPPLQQFDAATIRFQRANWRRSTKVSIDRFVLVP